jgi:beta-N-acetylhexosaminidase
MKLIASLFLIVLLLANSLLPAFGQKTAPAPRKLEPSEKAWKHADKILKKMTVEEKVGQLVHVGINARFANQDSEFFQDLKRDVVENKVGGIILFGAPIYETTHLVNRMQEQARIPLLISLDAETGIGMRFGDAANFPWNMAVAATGNPEYARKIGIITAREARALGIQHVYNPVLDVNNNAANPVINVRSYGEDPEDVARFGVASVEGIQSQGVLATAKHFPGHGDTNIDSHRGLPIIDVSRERLTNVELLPFKRAIDAGVGSIMIAHIGLPQIDPTEIKRLKDPVRGDAEEGAQIVVEKATVPATLSPVVQTEILRKEMGFKGLIVTDAMSMDGLTQYVTQEEAGVRAVLAGADVLEKPADTRAMLRGLVEAVKSGRISAARLDESVRKVLAWKYELGLFKQKITPIDQIDRIVSSREVYALADEIGSRAITLVRNQGNMLPLKKDARVAILAVTNGFEGNSTYWSLSRALDQMGVKYKGAVIQDNSSPERIAEARKMVAGADVVIAGLYGRVRSGATNSVGLPNAGVDILRGLLAQNKHVIGVSFGNPYILSAFPDLKTYLVAYGDMPGLQKAAGRAIFGEQSITGKLPITLPGLHPRGAGIQLLVK